MAIQIKSLARNTLPTPSEADLYAVPAGKAAIIKSVRLVNTGSSSAVVNLWFRRGTSGAGTSYRIIPKDLTLPPGGVDEPGRKWSLHTHPVDILSRSHC